MNESRPAGWPVWEPATLRVDPDLPPAAQVLATSGVPGRIIGYEYAALPEVQPVADDANLVAFGSSGLHGLVCLDLSDGRVLHLPDPDGPQRNPVNADLGRFIACARTVIDRFPFYDEDDESDRWEAVADELAAALAHIDSATAAHNSFWVTFLDDVRIGDYATSMIVDD